LGTVAEIHTCNPIRKISTAKLSDTFYFFTAQTMRTPEDDKLADFAEWGICPNCGVSITEGTTVVRGSGVFCSLNCVASFFAAEFKERARRLAIAARN
jgi:hypothetical protein